MRSSMRNQTAPTACSLLSSSPNLRLIRLARPAASTSQRADT
jgi:hypothetical protein